MKKYILVAAMGLLTTAAVTATVMSNPAKKTTKKEKKCSFMKAKCEKMSKVACY